MSKSSRISAALIGSALLFWAGVASANVNRPGAMSDRQIAEIGEYASKLLDATSYKHMQQIIESLNGVRAETLAHAIGMAQGTVRDLSTAMFLNHGAHIFLGNNVNDCSNLWDIIEFEVNEYGARNASSPVHNPNLVATECSHFGKGQLTQQASLSRLNIEPPQPSLPPEMSPVQEPKPQSVAFEDETDGDTKNNKRGRAPSNEQRVSQNSLNGGYTGDGGGGGAGVSKM